MYTFKKIFAAVALVGCCAVAGPSAAAGNTSTYYIFDGDSSVAHVINNATLTSSFSTYSLGYPPAITNTIWLGNRDNNGATEYTLAGVPTGNTSIGGTFISQILDGTTDGRGTNYGVTCCSPNNVVTVANSDWSNQAALFSINVEGAGIAYDTLTNTLFVSTLRSGGLINEYDLAGNVVSSFNAGGDIAGLAYEQSTDTLWGYTPFPGGGNLNLWQFGTNGAVLGNFSVAGNFSNPLGGEMVAGAVPEPETYAMMLAGLGLLGFTARRRKQKTA